LHLRRFNDELSTIRISGLSHERFCPGEHLRREGKRAACFSSTICHESLKQFEMVLEIDIKEAAGPVPAENSS
jgi:hypothetical protein